MPSPSLDHRWSSIAIRGKSEATPDLIGSLLAATESKPFLVA